MQVYKPDSVFLCEQRNLCHLSRLSVTQKINLPTPQQRASNP